MSALLRWLTPTPRVRRPPSTFTTSAFNPAKKPDVGFVACIESGVLEAQTILLFESLRLYAGRFSDCALYALSPRAGRAISNNARRKLDKLGVVYIDRILNTECPEYGSANRVSAAAYVEETYPHEILVILDSDTLFLGEPSEFALPPDIDVAVRPVDVKGMSSGGLSDPFDHYWQALCRCCGVDYDKIPFMESFVDHQRIKANYNGGLVVVRSGLGILRRWADFFFRSVREGLRPYPDARSFRTGTGWVEPAASTLWGSNQAALSLAIWSASRRVNLLPPTYNYPLHQHLQINVALARKVFPQLIHVHYHWLFAPDALSSNPLLRWRGPLSGSQKVWLRAATPIG